MLKHIIPILLVILLVVVILNTNLFVNFLLPKFIQTRITEVDIESLHVQRQYFEFPNKIVFENVDFAVNKNGQEIKFHSRLIRFHQIINVLQSKGLMKFDIEGLDVDWKDGWARGVKAKAFCDLKKKTPFFLQGILEGDALSYRKLNAGDFSARVRWSRKHLQIDEIQAEAYKGNSQGQASVEFYPYFNFVIWLEFFDFQSALLKDVNQEFFGQFDGKMTGAFRLTGFRESTDIFSLVLEMPEGCAIKTAFLKTIADSINELSRRENFLKLIRGPQVVEFNKARFALYKEGANELILDFRLIHNRNDEFNGIGYMRLKGGMEDLLLFQP